MNTDMYKKVEKFVTDAFTKAGKPQNIKHLKRTIYWVKYFKPDTDEAFLIAAVAHDIERAFRDVKAEKSFWRSDKGFRDEVKMDYHQKKGAEIIGSFLSENG